MKAFFTKVVGVVVAGVMGIMGTAAELFEPVDRVLQTPSYKRAASYTAVDYNSDSGEQLIPEREDGYWTFTTDRPFKVMQLTDIHIGGGTLSMSRDMKSLNAVASMIQKEKPDLVVITGDMAFPVPHASLTTNNAIAPEILMTLLDKLGVYYTVTFGNHDTENYGAYDREEIATKVYNPEKHPKLLFQSNLNMPEAKKDTNYELNTKPGVVDGCGNHVIRVKNTEGKITNAFFMIDSNAYTADDPTGLSWDYDVIHPDQVDWYKSELTKINEVNGNNSCTSMTFFHIPIAEYQAAWNKALGKPVDPALTNQFGAADAEAIRISGGLHEANQKSWHGNGSDGLFEAMNNDFKENKDKAIFCGHDHINNGVVKYGDVQLVYGMSVDYLAYPDLNFKGSQRGCTMITIDNGATAGNKISVQLNNYYELDANGNEKYPSEHRKEKVKMQFENDNTQPNTAGVR